METQANSDFAGKVVLVTGGARGIGRGIVTAFAEAGANVVLADYLADQATDSSRQIAAKTGVKVHPVAVDVRDAASVTRMVDETRGTFGRINVLVNNAAI